MALQNANVQPLTMYDALSLPDILDQSRYLIMFGIIPGSGDSRELSIACTACAWPGTSNEAYDVNLAGGFQLNFRGRRLHNTTMSLSFVVDGKAEVLHKLRSWKEFAAGSVSQNSQAYIANGPSSGSGGYSVTAQLYHFDTTGRVAVAHEIYRMYPQDIPEVSLTSDSSSPAIVTTTFRFTWSLSTSISNPL